MTTEQKEKLREVLIDYLQVLTSTSPEYPQSGYDKIHNQRIADVRLLLREVA
jgi:hypothetical protein